MVLHFLTVSPAVALAEHGFHGFLQQSSYYSKDKLYYRVTTEANSSFARLSLGHKSEAFLFFCNVSFLRLGTLFPALKPCYSDTEWFAPPFSCMPQRRFSQLGGSPRVEFLWRRSPFCCIKLLCFSTYLKTLREKETERNFQEKEKAIKIGLRESAFLSHLSV